MFSFKHKFNNVEVALSAVIFPLTMSVSVNLQLYNAFFFSFNTDPTGFYYHQNFFCIAS